MLNTILMLMLSQAAAHAKAAPTGIDLLAEAARALPSVAQVDLMSEVRHALHDAMPSSAVPLRR